MYEAFYGMRHRPFSPVPQPECFVPVPHMAQVLHDLEACVRRQQGIAVLTAPAGAGKTVLCQQLSRKLAGDFRIAHLRNARFPSRRALLQAILFEIGQSYIGLSEQEARLRIFESIRPGADSTDARPLVVLLDEAHLLAARFLEELRTLADYEVDGEALIRIVVSGQIPLEETLSEPPLSAFNQRVGCHATLEPLRADESAEYLRYRLAWAGAEIEGLFTPGALSLVVHAADGNPRRISQLADHALLIGYAEEQLPVSQGTVQNALIDLRELPLHWNEPLSLSESVDMIDLPFADSELPFLPESDATLPVEPVADASSDEESGEAAVFEWGGEPSSAGDAAWRGETASAQPASAEPEAVYEPAPRFEWPLSEETTEPGAAGVYETEPSPSTQAADETAMYQIPYEEVLVEDRYALLDRNAEVGRAAYVEVPPPAAAEVLSYDGSGEVTLPHGELSIEENLHALLQSMRAEVLEAISISEPPAYDVVEPDDEPEAEPELMPVHAFLEEAVVDTVPAADPVDRVTLPMPSAWMATQTAPVEQVEAEVEAAAVADEAPRRYAHLFSRLQRQRSKMEAFFRRKGR